ncbi:MAG: hypothetical protein K1W21_07475, partial [Oscillospiraceae bacterium]
IPFEMPGRTAFFHLITSHQLFSRASACGQIAKFQAGWKKDIKIGTAAPCRWYDIVVALGRPFLSPCGYYSRNPAVFNGKNMARGVPRGAGGAYAHH